MTLPQSPPTDAEYLAAIPTDWLEAYADYLGDHEDLDPDAAFVRSVAALFRLREISQREGCRFAPHPMAALAELARRREAGATAS